VISCSDAVRQLWQYLEDDLSPTTRADIEEHLGLCRRCCGELEFADELRGFLANAARPALPDDVETRLVAFLDDLEHGRAGPEESTP
jgi:anti-sigma factor RsiW